MKRLLCSILCIAAACVGPARTDRAYEAKAVETAKAVASAVETARLAARAAGEGKATGQYLSVLLGETENEAGAASGAFDSILPPSGQAEALHDRLAELIATVVDVLRDLRIAARRSQIDSLPGIARGLEGPADALHRFVESRE